MKRSRVAHVGNTPGMTKSVQEVQLDKDIILLDCPGVIQSQDNADSLILRNAIKLEEIKDPIRPVDILLQKVD